MEASIRMELNILTKKNNTKKKLNFAETEAGIFKQHVLQVEMVFMKAWIGSQIN